jgi:hypothetical protein
MGTDVGTILPQAGHLCPESGKTFRWFGSRDKAGQHPDCSEAALGFRGWNYPMGHSGRWRYYVVKDRQVLFQKGQNLLPSTSGHS